MRSLDAAWSIAWETQAAPERIDGNRVAFVWLFGMDAAAERHEFELLLAGEPLLRFRNPSAATLEAWEIEGESGARLEFRPTHIDRHEDVFGFALLELPAERVTPGQPLRLEVVGESAGSRIWYMTFRASPEAGAQVSARNAILRDATEPWQPVVLEAIHLGASTDGVVSTSWGLERPVTLELGANRFELPHAVVDEAVDERVSLRAADGTDYQLNCRVAPVRPWTLFLVQHTHTDLGYTRPQTEILPDHLRYIDYALDYCDLTDDYPDEAKFRWTCEASWPVREWLDATARRQQIERLQQRVAEGPHRADGDVRQHERAARRTRLRRQPGGAATRCAATRLPVVSAMQDDVNGISWSLRRPACPSSACVT